VGVRALYPFDFRLSSAKFIMTLSAKQLAQSTRRRERLIEICQALPEVTYEVVGKEHIAFRVRKKIFAYYLFDHHGDGMIAFSCKSSLNEQRRLVRDDPDSFFVPAYVGPRGWVAIRLDLNEVDWDTVNELARQAFQSIAPRKLAALIEQS
jgi:phosphoribosylglycinamide formyltransferase-1